MPINILRLNHAASSHPNDRIAFIKPLPLHPGLHADQTHADTFLRAIAAQCLPIMKTHQLSITTLEEHEPNREFIGRNFNNGEVIQLVLRRRDGSWMSFRQVQMVMMHELAHNVQMNHGKAFWVERNRLVGEMKGLWDKGYTGEGFWGSGRSLENLQSHAGNMVAVGEGREVEGLCGGTYRSRGRKRKRKRGGQNGNGALTWREQKERRIEKKFGKNGVALGGDEDARIKLEISRPGPLGGKPRVAGSRRGRELRAAAALARFEVEKEEKVTKEETEDEDGSRTEGDGSSADEADVTKTAVDVNGNRLLDSMGFSMIKVCGDEDVDEVNVKQEMEDFDELDIEPSRRLQETQSSTSQPKTSNEATKSSTRSPPTEPTHDSDTLRAGRFRKSLYSVPQHRASPTPPQSPPLPTHQRQNPTPANSTFQNPPPSRQPAPALQPTVPNPSSSPPSSSTPTTAPPTISSTCPICTTSTPNPSMSITCPTCAHVLDRKKDHRSWKCGREACRGAEYVNAGDCGRCGGCGGQREDAKS